MKIDNTSSIEDIHRAFVTQIVKLIDAGRSSDTQLFVGVRDTLRSTMIEEVKINKAVAMYMQRLRSRNYAYESQSTGRWVWVSRKDWPLALSQDIVNHLLSDTNIRLTDILKLT